MQMDTTNRGFHPEDIERLCEQRRKGAEISKRDFGALTTSQVCRAASGWDRRFRLCPGHTQSDLGKLEGRQEVMHGVSLQTALNLDPFMIHETFLCLTETAFGSHPCRVVSVTYRKLRPFHGGNTGSNPVGDAKLINNFQIPSRILYVR